MQVGGAVQMLLINLEFLFGNGRSSISSRVVFRRYDYVILTFGMVMGGILFLIA